MCCVCGCGNLINHENICSKNKAAYRRELEAAGEKRNELYNSLMAKFEAVRSPLRTAEVFDIPDIIDPRDTRPILCDWVKMVYEHVLPHRLEKIRVHGPKVLYRP